MWVTVWMTVFFVLVRDFETFLWNSTVLFGGFFSRIFLVVYRHWQRRTSSSNNIFSCFFYFDCVCVCSFIAFISVICAEHLSYTSRLSCPETLTTLCFVALAISFHFVRLFPVQLFVCVCVCACLCDNTDILVADYCVFCFFQIRLSNTQCLSRFSTPHPRLTTSCLLFCTYTCVYPIGELPHRTGQRLSLVHIIYTHHTHERRHLVARSFMLSLSCVDYLGTLKAIYIPPIWLHFDILHMYFDNWRYVVLFCNHARNPHAKIPTKNQKPNRTDHNTNQPTNHHQISDLNHIHSTPTNPPPQFHPPPPETSNTHTHSSPSRDHQDDGATDRGHQQRWLRCLHVCVQSNASEFGVPFVLDWS